MRLFRLIEDDLLVGLREIESDKLEELELPGNGVSETLL